ncbi:hypothetical protein ACFOD9_10660 [Novosphingobium bradum]|uniref:Flp pilus assembly protein CpaB n=1 Tax=Novosphingobium bradum TaxID=1737444 RepID=A0ABV7ISZ1_9SPHN
MKRPGRIALILIAVLGAALLAWAWANGGREPLREIAEPVAVPESAR